MIDRTDLNMNLTVEGFERFWACLTDRFAVLFVHFYGLEMIPCFLYCPAINGFELSSATSESYLLDSMAFARSSHAAARYPT